MNVKFENQSDIFGCLGELISESVKLVPKSARVYLYFKSIEKLTV